MDFPHEPQYEWGVEVYEAGVGSDEAPRVHAVAAKDELPDVAVDQERGHDLLHVGPSAACVDTLGEEGVHAGRMAVVKVGEQVLQVVVVVVAVLDRRGRLITAIYCMKSALLYCIST